VTEKAMIVVENPG